MVKENGYLESYYLLKGEAREKITLSDLVNEQIDFVKPDFKTKVEYSGDWAQIGSSGYQARIELSGCDGVAFACGYLSVIKAKKDTWISLCEYTKNGDGKYIPTFALSAQVGNPNYTDCFGKILSENDFYILRNKKFTPVICDDGILLLKKKSKIKDGIEIIKCIGMNDTNEIFCVRK